MSSGQVVSFPEERRRTGLKIKPSNPIKSSSQWESQTQGAKGSHRKEQSGPRVVKSLVRPLLLDFHCMKFYVSAFGEKYQCQSRKANLCPAGQSLNQCFKTLTTESSAPVLIKNLFDDSQKARVRKQPHLPHCKKCSRIKHLPSSSPLFPRCALAGIHQQRAD